MTLVALPVAGLVAAAMLTRAAVPSREGQVTQIMGSADLVATGGLDDPELNAFRSILPAGSTVAVIESLSVSTVRDGYATTVTIEELSQDPTEPPLAGRWSLRSGRVPGAVGEATVHPALLTRMGSEVGGRIEIADLRLEVVGTIVHTITTRNEIVVVGPGTLPANEEPQRELLVSVPPGTDLSAIAGAKPDSIGMISRGEMMRHVGDDRRSLDATLVGGTIVLLLGTGLIAAAAFVVGARRQLRAIGLLGSVGADHRHVRTAVLLGGTTLGLAGSIAGATLGVIAAVLIRPHLGRVTARLVGPIDFSLLPIVIAVALGTVAATTAALLPARWAARLRIVEALAGVTAPPRPASRLVRAGLLMSLPGTVILIRGTIVRDGVQLGVGFVLVVGGFLLLIPLVVAAVGRLGSRMPALLRIAARDTARHGRRTSAAIAAAALALAMPVGAAAASRSIDAKEQGRKPIDDHQMIARFEGLPEDEGRAATAIATLRAALPNAAVGTVTQAIKEPYSISVQAAGLGERRYDTTLAVGLYVGDEHLLRALGAGEGIEELRRGWIVSTARGTVRDGTVLLQLPPDLEGTDERLLHPAAEVDGAALNLEFLPRFVISAEAAAAQGFTAGATGLILIRTPKPLTPDDVRRARAAAATVDGLAIQTAEDMAPGSRQFRGIAVAGGIAVALIVVAVTVALVGAEARRDAAILAAVGAGPRLRRTLAASRAGLIAMCAAILAVPAGFVPAAIVQAARVDPYPIVVPWLTLALVCLATPAVAAVVAGIGSRRPQPVTTLRPPA
ncbi:MAG TPA: FtsX-like permease family protein [Actinomycetota bacterium]|nr:FtsX-like permease family protein [Actinomycetota bacterium]